MVNRVFCIVSFLIFLTSSVSAVNILKNVTVDENLLKLEFRNSLSKKEIKASAISSKGTTKYYFDFKKCYLSKGVKREFTIDNSVKTIKVAQYKPDVVRVVIYSKIKYKVKYYQKGKPIFYITLPKDIKYSNVSKKSQISPKNLFSNMKIDDKDTPKKDLSSNKSLYSITKLKNNYKIMIDAGHGGKDPGAIVSNVREKDIVLQISKKVYRKLKTLGFKVELTRKSNYYLTLGTRTRKANRKNADLFISIHANSIKNRSRREKAYGIETYFLSQARTARAKRIAARENSMLLKQVDRTTQEVLLNTVFTGPKIILSNKLAIDVQKGILNSLRSRYTRVKDNGVKGAPFYVLVGAQMPSILIEVGYLSNSMERKRLTSKTYQEMLSSGIVNGILSYFQNREKELE